VLAACAATPGESPQPQGAIDAAAARGELSEDELELYRLLLAYRAEHRLPAIPLSRSLTEVARLHAADLERNGFDGTCNIHSWSRSGSWKACCYLPDHSEPGCMWNKPRELTAYKGPGFEVAYWNRSVARPATAMRVWKSSATHDDVLRNRGRWRSDRWKSVGVGVHGRYAVLWLGLDEDPAGYWSTGR